LNCGIFSKLVFYHRAKGEHPERKKNIKSSNKTTPEKTGYRSIPVCQAAVLINKIVAETEEKNLKIMVWRGTMGWPTPG
jgi:hypothetical protein